MEELNVQDQVFKEQHAAPEVSLQEKFNYYYEKQKTFNYAVSDIFEWDSLFF